MTLLISPCQNLDPQLHCRCSYLASSLVSGSASAPPVQPICINRNVDAFCSPEYAAADPGMSGYSLLCILQVPSMVTGGTLWFTDLTSPDPYYGLPILTGAFMLAMVQLNAAEGMQGQSPAMIRNFKIGMSVLAVAIIPFSYLLPKVRSAGPHEHLPHLTCIPYASGKCCSLSSLQSAQLVCPARSNESHCQAALDIAFQKA